MIFSLNEQFDLDKIFNSDWNHYSLFDLVSPENSKLTNILNEFSNQQGVYIFWWKGSLDELQNTNRNILLKGKKQGEEFFLYPVEWDLNWLTPIEINGVNHYALYVGKSTTLRNRIRQHFHFPLNHESWQNEINNPQDKNGSCRFEKLSLLKMYYNQENKMLYSPTTSCQFRSGIEMLFRNKAEEYFWNSLKKNVSLSVIKFDTHVSKSGILSKDDGIAVAGRFYIEDYLIGALRPWFNLDSER